MGKRGSSRSGVYVYTIIVYMIIIGAIWYVISNYSKIDNIEYYNDPSINIDSLSSKLDSIKLDK